MSETSKNGNAFPSAPLANLQDIVTRDDIDVAFRAASKGFDAWVEQAYSSSPAKEELIHHFHDAWLWLDDDELGVCPALDKLMDALRYNTSREAENIRDFCRKIFDFYEYDWYPSTVI